MKKYILALLAILVPLLVFADGKEPMQVKSFVLLEQDQTANLQGSMVIDQNGDKCALIRVQTTQTGFAWDTGHMPPVKILQKTGEIWLYVSYGIKKITIRHQQLGSQEYYFPVPVEKARTYRMELISAPVQVLVDGNRTSNQVIFLINPSDAVVEIDGQTFNLDGGRLTKQFDFGKYKYSVSAPGFHTETGEINVEESPEALVRNISLTPAKGTIKVSGVDGARVFVDDELLGDAPGTFGPLSIGAHTVRISKELYEDYITTVTVQEDGKEYLLSPTMKLNCVRVTIETNDNAEIWIDGRMKGTGKWEGDVALGNHILEARKEGRKPSSVTKHFTLMDEGKQVRLPETTIGYGKLEVTSTPEDVKVLLDGKFIGRTPLTKDNVPSGRYNLSLEKSGYQTCSTTVEVPIGETVKENRYLYKQQKTKSYSSSSYRSSETRKHNWFHRNIISMGYEPMNLLYYDSKLKMRSVSLSYRHFVPLGTDVLYLDFGVNSYISFGEEKSSETKLAGWSFAAPVEMALRLGPFRFGGGVYGALNAVASSEVKTDRYGDTQTVNLIEEGLARKFFAGWRVGVDADFGMFHLGYHYSRSFNSTPVLQDGNLKVGLECHLISMGICF